MSENTRLPKALDEQGWTWSCGRIVRFFIVTPDSRDRLTFEYIDGDGECCYGTARVEYLTPPKPTLEGVLRERFEDWLPATHEAIAATIRAAWPDVDFGTPA